MQKTKEKQHFLQIEEKNNNVIDWILKINKKLILDLVLKSIISNIIKIIINCQTL